MRALVALVFICMLLPKAAVSQLSCYTCDPTNCKTYTKQDCPTGSDSCLSASATLGDNKFTLKTCAPKQICDTPPTTFMGLTVADVKCCQTNLCNSAESFTLSFLVMFIPLLSSLLFF
ncbi:hypothetical protein KOW79_013141 [Hemibagrus wyckioides]|uniref:UPAR/Ly6 domain-containing protein n=1 Tax=Hemibagrus wyckioides TaxID=337641 RepID=A0A9D3NJE1_9TELE|nr:hypothetical protein KOW79_013141 [Hemibagrus wyckioides]